MISNFLRNLQIFGFFDNVLEDGLFQELRASIDFKQQIVDGHGKRKLTRRNGLDEF